MTGESETRIGTESEREIRWEFEWNGEKKKTMKTRRWTKRDKI